MPSIRLLTFVPRLRSPVSLSARTPVMPRMPSNIRIRRARSPYRTASTRRGKPTRK